MKNRTLIPIASLLTVLLAGCGGAKSVDPKAAIAEGAEFCIRYNFDLAVGSFASARAAAEPGSELWLQATLGLAVARHQQVPIELDRIAEAARLYEEVAEKGGTSLLAARACLNRGRIAEQSDTNADVIDLAGARAWYQKVIDGWPEQPMAGEATLRLAVTWMQTLKPDDVRIGIRLCEERAARPGETWAGSLWKQAGDAWWLSLRDHTQAIRALAKCVETGHPDPARAWTTSWRIATLAEEIGDRPNALTYYRRIIERHPTSGRAWDAQNRMRALGAEPPPIKLAILPEEKKG